MKVQIGSVIEGNYFHGERKVIHDGERYRRVRIYERNLGPVRYKIGNYVVTEADVAEDKDTISYDSFIGRALLDHSVGALVYVCFATVSDTEKVDCKILITKIS